MVPKKNEIKKPDYREVIVEMIRKICDERFLLQIYTIIKRHIEKEGS